MKALCMVSSRLSCTAVLEQEELQGTHPDARSVSEDVSAPMQSVTWGWLLDLERAVFLLVGSCLGRMLQDPIPLSSETSVRNWLQYPLFSNGLEMEPDKLGSAVRRLTEAALAGSVASPDLETDIPGDTDLLLDIALGAPREPALSITRRMRARTQDGAAEPEVDPQGDPLDLVARFVFAAALKHTGGPAQAREGSRAQQGEELADIYQCVLHARNDLLRYQQDVEENIAQQLLELVGLPETVEETEGQQNQERPKDLQQHQEGSRHENESGSQGEQGSSQGGEDIEDLSPNMKTLLQSFFSSRAAAKFLKNEIAYESMGMGPSSLAHSSIARSITSEGLGPGSALLNDQSRSTLSGPFLAACKAVISICAFLILGVKSVGPEREDMTSDVDFENRWVELTVKLSLGIGHESHEEADSGVLTNQEPPEAAVPPPTVLPSRQDVSSLQKTADPWDNVPKELSQAPACSRPSRAQILANIREFISGSLPPSSSQNGKHPGTEEVTVGIAVAMNQQQKRAEVRLEALQGITSFLSEMAAERSVLHSSSSASLDDTTRRERPLQTARLQFLIGCFILEWQKSQPSDKLQTYMSGMESLRESTRQALHTAALSLYRGLVEVLRKVTEMEPLNTGSRRHLQLVLLTVLSVHYHAADIMAVAGSGLLKILPKLADICVLPNQRGLVAKISSYQQLDLATQLASARLQQILALLVCSSMDTLPATVVLETLEALHLQLLHLLKEVSQAESLSPRREDPSGITGPDGAAHGAEDRPVPTSSPTTEAQLGDFLAFVRRVVSVTAVQGQMDVCEWIKPLVHMVAERRPSGAPVIQTLRCRMLILHLLEALLPACSSSDVIQEMVEKLFEVVSGCVWIEPFAMAKKLRIDSASADMSSAAVNEDTIDIPEVSFEPKKLLSCTLESGNMLVHSSGGKGYGLARCAITSGCFTWKFHITIENKENEGTCVGVSRWPIADVNHRTSQDMWLYRAYSGHLYHGGELSRVLAPYSQGDCITCVLDVEARTLSFAKNEEEQRIAFEELDATEMYPCVMFYGSKPGEKVMISDLKMRRLQQDFFSGEPHCTPRFTAVAQTTADLLCRLHQLNSWTTAINSHILSQLQLLPLYLEPQKVDLKSLEHKTPDGPQPSASQLTSLCSQVWPVLAVMGGIDKGIRVGSHCVHRPSGRKAVLLGVLQKDSKMVKVQWEDSEAAVSDMPFSSLDPLESPGLDISRLHGLKPCMILDLLRLTDLYAEAEMDLTRIQWKDSSRLKLTMDIQENTDIGLKAGYEPEMVKTSINGKGVTSTNARVEVEPENSTPSAHLSLVKEKSSLKQEMLALVEPGLGESAYPQKEESPTNIDHRGVEEPISPHQQSPLGETSEAHTGRSSAHLLKDASQTLPELGIPNATFDEELRDLQLSWLSLAAAKSLNVLIHDSEYSRLLLLPSQHKSPGHVQDNDLQQAFEQLVRSMMKKSLLTCPIKEIWPLAELERTHIMVQQKVLEALEEDINSSEGPQGNQHFAARDMQEIFEI
ncbi:hypothetical protein NDU88_000367 [Pleurodeles waltl]|uniref:B30.2/SPRY domain-containing protein n=1 Tax=Pleurodeles waltl TaxID=8319 RepID=A0AAV7WHZ9_PLEWA|nr:hypothetical protein NDU88_000367 [Pleurodeles waltl]